jgi:hypothetical protein
MREVTAGQGRTVADIDAARGWLPARTAPGGSGARFCMAAMRWRWPPGNLCAPGSGRGLPGWRSGRAAMLTALAGISRVYLGCTGSPMSSAAGPSGRVAGRRGHRWTIVTRHYRSQPRIPGPGRRKDRDPGPSLPGGSGLGTGARVRRQAASSTPGSRHAIPYRAYGRTAMNRMPCLGRLVCPRSGRP